MRGLYAHASERMRDELKAALQARWEDSLRARAAIHSHSPVALLDELLAPFRAQIQPRADTMTRHGTPQEPTAPGGREKLISQIPPKTALDPTLGTRMGSTQRASDLAIHQKSAGGAEGIRTPGPLDANEVRYRTALQPQERLSA